MSPKLSVAMLKFAHALPTGLCLFSDRSFGSAAAWYPRGWIWEEAPGDTAKIKVLSNIAAKSHHWASKAFKKPFHTTNRIAKPVSGCPLWWGQCLQHEWACITIPPGKVAKPRYQPLSTVRGGCGTWDSHGVRLPGTWQKRSGLNGFNGHTPDPKTRPKHPKTKATTWDWKSHYYRVWRNAPDSRLIVECDSEVNEVCNLQSEPLGQQTTVLR